jgi:hypothetical protein
MCEGAKIGYLAIFEYYFKQLGQLNNAEIATLLLQLEYAS